MSSPSPSPAMDPFPSTFFPFDADDGRDADPAFLSAIADAEARVSLRSPPQPKRRDPPSESVASSFSRSPYRDNSTATSVKRAKAEPEGEYLAALRGMHSETWQSMSSKMRPDGKAKGPAFSSNSANVGFEGGGVTSGGGACFHCGHDGHWARDCPNKPNASTSWGTDSGSMPQVPEKNCPCGAGLCKVLTANTEKNPGRQFYKCPLRKEEGQCGFFEWCDAPVTATTQGASKDKDGVLSDFPCPCGAGSCVILIAKTERNMGRQFFRCPLNQGEGACGFFKWCDDNSPVSATTRAPLGTTFQEKATPPQHTPVGQCYKCGMGGHWAKDCINPRPELQSFFSKDLSNTMRSNQIGSATSGACYKCGQADHWANNCPNQQLSQTGKFSCRDFPSTRDYNVSGAGGTVIGASVSGGCFKCGSHGHWSRDCPTATNKQSSSYGQGLSSDRTAIGSGSCYKCGGQGHWANQCRMESKGRGMY